MIGIAWFLSFYLSVLILVIMLHFQLLITVLSVDAIDMSGKHEVDLDTNIWKVRKPIYSYCFSFMK